MVQFEVELFLRPNELAAAERLFGLFEVEPLSRQIAEEAAPLFRRWNPSHGVSRGDALMAAAALRAGGRIVTLNVRHFPMPGLAVERAWD